MASQPNHEGKYSMPIKEAYKKCIKESLDHDTQELLYEFLDEYSYSNAKYAVIHLRANKKGEFQLYLAMEFGPKDGKTMTKILQWSVSGKSKENGHQGGGNLRLIYGHASDRIILVSVINNDEFIRAETKPNEIYALSCNNTITEGEFQIKVDRECIKWPTDCLNLEEDGAWFNDYRTEMKEAGIPVDYVMRISLTNPRKEYTDIHFWNYLKTLIQMKNYNIPVYFKNEILNETEFTVLPNIDLMGLDHKEPNTEKTIELYLSDIGDGVLKYNDKYINSKGEEIPFNDTLKKLGTVILYKIDECYLKEQLKQLNAVSPERKYTQEDFYGVYIKLNGKQTNYLPIPDILPLSKNVGSELGNSCFRLVIEPTCNDNVLERLIITDKIKAKTCFKDKGKAKKIVLELIKFAKMNSYDLPDATPDVIKPKPKKGKQEYGQNYLVHLGEQLYKYGYVTSLSKMESRMNDHRNESIDNVSKFCDLDMREKYCKPIHYTTPLKNYKGFEQRIGQILEENLRSSDGNEKIILFQHKQSEHEQREYFICKDMDYLFETIIPLIIKEQQEY